MSVETKHFRLMPTRQLDDHRAGLWIMALKMLGWAARPEPDEDLDDLAARLEPHMVAIDDALREFSGRVPRG